MIESTRKVLPMMKGPTPRIPDCGRLGEYPVEPHLDCATSRDSDEIREVGRGLTLAYLATVLTEQKVVNLTVSRAGKIIPLVFRLESSSSSIPLIERATSFGSRGAGRLPSLPRREG